jgi:hypothetical protein
MLLLLSIVVVVGCEPERPTTPAGPGHGGQLFEMPGKVGWVEVASEIVPDEKSRSGKTILYVYFLRPDARTIVTPAPTNPGITLELPSGRKSVPLSSRVRANDPNKDVGFATPPGSYQGHENLSGEVTATIDGQPVTVSFASR